MVWEAKGKTAVMGVGFSKLGRALEGTLGARCLEACANAINDAGLELSDIDGIASYPEPPFRGAGSTDGRDMVSVNYIMRHLKVGPDDGRGVRWYAQIDQGMVLSAVIEAINALAAGACNYALVWRALHRPRGAYGAVSDSYARGDAQFQTPYGFASSFQPHSLAYRRYMHLYGAKREDMATLAVTQRANANLNEKAYFFETPMTRDDYMDSRMIADPLCLFDCDIPVEGAAALVLTTAERARDLPNPPAYVAGYGQNTSNMANLMVYPLLDYMETGGSIADRVWERSGMGPTDVDVALLYDGFSPSVYYWLESAGFCGRGEAHQFIQDGRIERNGQLPVNTHGGALSEGRLHSIGHLAEGVYQVTGRAGDRQVPGCRTAYVTAGSPMLRGSGLLLTAEP